MFSFGLQLQKELDVPIGLIVKADPSLPAADHGLNYAQWRVPFDLANAASVDSATSP